MAERTLPNVGLKGGYDPGEVGWGPGMATNLLMLSVLTQGTVIDKIDAEPGSPAAGDTYILDETHATHPNEIAVFDGPIGEEAWVYIPANEGWLLYNQAAGYYEKFDGLVWAELATGGGGATGPAETISDSTTARNILAADQGKYIRFTNAGAKTFTAQPESTEALPADGEWHIRNAGAGDLTLVEGSGVTINPPNGGTLVIPENGTATVKRVAEDTFDLLGQTVAV